ncbi:MAG: hypothetical protein HN712_29510, partial [Gemmatimonadetes bacterium]|nr:hypothetical protein [Gemmatimonadota bacterium]
MQWSTPIRNVLTLGWLSENFFGSHASHYNITLPSAELPADPEPIDRRLPVYPIRILTMRTYLPVLLCGLLLGLAQTLPAAETTMLRPQDTPVPTTQITLLATGKGFVRLQYDASVVSKGDRDPAAVDQVFTAPIHNWMEASLVGLPPGAEPRLHVLEARQAVAWQAAERNGSLT